MDVQISLQNPDFSSLGYILRDALAVSYIQKFYFSFWGISILFSIVAKPFSFAPTVYMCSDFSSSFTTLAVFCFYLSAYLWFPLFFIPSYISTVQPGVIFFCLTQFLYYFFIVGVLVTHFSVFLCLKIFIFSFIFSGEFTGLSLSCSFFFFQHLKTNLIVLCPPHFFFDKSVIVPVKGEIIWYLSLTTWLISLSIMLSSSIHAVAKGISSLFLSTA